MKKSFSGKKLLSLLLAVLLVVSCVPVSFAAAEYDETSATFFNFSDSAIAVSEGKYNGYKISKTELTISGEGTYILSGSCSNGSIKVKKGVKDVTLVLNGLDLTSAATAPLTCSKSSAVKIVAASNTVNTFTDSAKNNDDNYSDNTEAENAVIKCKDGSQVVLCGDGTLNINANGKNGIKSGATTEEEGEASLLIRDITLNITATVNDAINAEQLLTVESGTLTITAADDAVHCDYTLLIGKEGEAGPTIKVVDCYEGFEGANITVFSGDITIHAQDDGMNAANSDLKNYDFTLEIAGGNLYIDTLAGDGLDANGELLISGGNVVIWTADRGAEQPLDADKNVTITGGTVFAAGGSSGMGMKLVTSVPYVTFGEEGRTGGFGGFPGMRRDAENGADAQSVSDGEKPADMPSMPDGEKPADVPSMPDGEMPADMPSMPDGEKPADMPSMPDGEMPSDMPSMPDGEMPSDMPSVPEDENGGKSRAAAAAQKLGFNFPGRGETILAKGETVTIKDASGNVLYSDTAVYEASYVLFAGDVLVSGENYSLFSCDSEAETAAATFVESQNCKHICHRTGFLSKIIWAVACFFCKIFKINRTCSCGAAHWQD